MDDNNKNEMEQIQRGLEAFLEKEIDGAGDPGRGRRSPRKSWNSRMPGESRRMSGL